MRIISGGAGGIRLYAPPGDAVRPTTDRVKESVFASLEPFRGRRVVDLFSGTGALGLEALSRGAAAVVLVERDRRVQGYLRDNVARVCKAIGVDVGVCQIVPLDVASVPHRLSEWAGRVDIIFADPPYHPSPQAYGGAALLQDAEFARWAGQALLVLEHAARPDLPWYPVGNWRPVACKQYGSLAVTFARVASLGKGAVAGSELEGARTDAATAAATGLPTAAGGSARA